MMEEEVIAKRRDSNWEVRRGDPYVDVVTKFLLSSSLILCSCVRLCGLSRIFDFFRKFDFSLRIRSLSIQPHF